MCVRTQGRALGLADPDQDRLLPTLVGRETLCGDIICQVALGRNHSVAVSQGERRLLHHAFVSSLQVYRQSQAQYRSLDIFMSVASVRHARAHTWGLTRAEMAHDAGPILSAQVAASSRGVSGEKAGWGSETPNGGCIPPRCSSSPPRSLAASVACRRRTRLPFPWLHMRGWAWAAPTLGSCPS